MAVTVKKAVLWRKEVESQPGVLAATLKPLAEAGADLQIVMGYRLLLLSCTRFRIKSPRLLRKQSV